MTSHQSLFLNTLTPDFRQGYEQLYNVTIPNTDAYQLINTAVWYTLGRLAAGYNCVWNGVEGGTCYYIGCGGEHIQIFVVRLTSHAAVVRLFPLIPADPIEGMLWSHTKHEQIRQAVVGVFMHCHEQARRFLRAAAEAENYNPPRPKTNDWKERIDWLDTYHLDKSTEEQAKLLSVSVKTLQNNRSMLEREKHHRVRRKNREDSGT